MILEDDLRTPDKAAARRELHRPIEWTRWKRLTQVFWMRKFERLYFEKMKHMYPGDLTNEQRRRLYDLGDPYGEYASDDPRRYDIYDQGTSGFVPPPGLAPHVRREYHALLRDQGWVRLFTVFPEITREEFRRFLDGSDPRQLYDSDDARRYGVYGLSIFEPYTPTEEDLKFDGRVFKFWDTPEGPPRVVDTTNFSLEQYRRLFDFGDPEAEYDPLDPRKEGLYGGGAGMARLAG